MTNQTHTSARQPKKRSPMLVGGATIISFVALLYIVEAFDQLNGHRFDDNGIRPLETDGLAKVARLECRLVEIEVRLESKARQLGRQLKLPGFRKGKVPRPILERVLYLSVPNRVGLGMGPQVMNIVRAAQRRRHQVVHFVCSRVGAG